MSTKNWKVSSDYVKAVLFDVDGVLLDSDEQYVKIYEDVAKFLGLKSPDASFFRARFGKSAESILLDAYGDYPEGVKFFRERERQMVVSLMYGVEELLKKIKIKKGLVSTKAKDLINIFLADVIEQFDVVVSGDDTEKHKPDPEPILLCCKKLGVEPKEAVYVGDAMADYQAAKNADTEFIGFVSGGATDEEFRKAGVKTIVHTMKELGNLIHLGA